MARPAGSERSVGPDKPAAEARGEHGLERSPRRGHTNEAMRRDRRRLANPNLHPPGLDGTSSVTVMGMGQVVVGGRQGSKSRRPEAPLAPPPTLVKNSLPSCRARNKPFTSPTPRDSQLSSLPSLMAVNAIVTVVPSRALPVLVRHRCKLQRQLGLGRFKDHDHHDRMTSNACRSRPPQGVNHACTSFGLTDSQTVSLPAAPPC